jgi:drug/metabolite transporter (DMT)-like permease
MHLGALIFISIVWGMAFISIRWLLVAYTPIQAMSLRFLSAALFSLPFIFYFKSWRHSFKKIKLISLCGFFLFTLLFFQMMGLEITTVAKSAFITTLHAILTPLFEIIFYKKKYSIGYWLMVIFALFGVALMCDGNLSNFNKGDFLTLFAAIFSALHIIVVGKVAREFDNSVESNMMQSLVAGACCLILLLVTGTTISLTPLFFDLRVFAPTPFSAWIYLVFFSSMFAFTLQTWGQKRVKPHVASAIYLLESPFAALFGFYLIQESLTPRAILGSVIILVSVIFIPYFERKST